MTNIPDLTFVPEKLHNLSYEELLEYYDNPRNFNVKDCRSEQWNNMDKKFPSHSLIFLTHGSYAVNEQIRRTTELTKAQFNRLIKNYSDFGTRKMIKKSGLPEENVIYFPGSRAIGDPNRKYQNEKDDKKLEEGKKYIRNTDFNGQKIINNPGQFRDIGRDKTEKYDFKISNKLNLKEKKYGGTIGYDIHCTDARLMNIDSKLDEFREGGFPEIILSTRDGESCNQEILVFFTNRLKYYLGLDIHINEKFKGGYITSKHGMNYREEVNNGNGAQKSKRNMIQVELGRYLYIKSSTQEVDWERMEILGEGIKRAIVDTGIEFGEKYFNGIS